LEDGTVFSGRACAASGEAFGQIGFNTSMIGYEEVICDPANAGKILAMTYPQIGNYGINLAELEGKPITPAGLVVRAMCYTPSSWRAEIGLAQALAREGVVAIEALDTRSLTRHIRDHGALFAAISTYDLDPASLLGKLEAFKGAALARAAAAGEGGQDA